MQNTLSTTYIFSSGTIGLIVRTGRFIASTSISPKGMSIISLNGSRSSNNWYWETKSSKSYGSTTSVVQVCKI